MMGLQLQGLVAEKCEGLEGRPEAGLLVRA